MVQLQIADCPHCHKKSYFESDLNRGYCTYCGKIINPASDSQITVTLPDGYQSAPGTHILTVRYVKRRFDYGRTIMVAVKGPESKEFAVNINESVDVELQDGEYQVIGKVFHTSSVNSAEIIGSINISLRENMTISAESGGIIGSKLIFK